MLKRTTPRPNFFIVGAPRCGTTAMYTYLKLHPEIFLSLLKEPMFFAADLTRPGFAVTDEVTYLGLFAEAAWAKAIGEGSVWYLLSSAAPYRIREFSPSPRIIVMLRDPVDMMHSLHELYLRTGNEEITDFGEAIGAEADRALGRRIPARTYFPEGLLYTRVARYSEGLARYLNCFGRERVHPIIFEDLVADPGGTYRKTLEFLGVNATFQAEFDLAKATALIRPTVLRQIRSVPPEVRHRIKTPYRNHIGPRGDPVRPELGARLQRQLLPEVEKLSRLLDRDLTYWCRREARALDEPPPTSSCPSARPGG